MIFAYFGKSYLYGATAEWWFYPFQFEDNITNWYVWHSMWSLFELEIESKEFFVGCYLYALLTLALHIGWSETKWNRDI